MMRQGCRAWLLTSGFNRPGLQVSVCWSVCCSILLLLVLAPSGGKDGPRTQLNTSANQPRTPMDTDRFETEAVRLGHLVKGSERSRLRCCG
ncbi:hypothetical protein J3E68DRAFT_403009 [Trichoderma sp. SZMC 28012]